MANVVAAKVLSGSGWRAVFFVSGPIVAIWAPLMLMVLPADPKPRQLTPPPLSPYRQPTSRVSKEAQGDGPPPSALSIPGVGATSTCYTLTKCSRYCLMFWLPFFLSEEAKLSPSTASLVASLLDLAGAFGAIATGVATDTFYGGATLRAAMHLCCATGISFCFWAAACATGASTWMHITAIISVGFFIAG